MQTMRYTLQDFSNITFEGFNIQLPENTLNIISELALQVGSPTYIKTPNFIKKENSIGDSFLKKKRSKNNMEIMDDNWESIRKFQPTKIEQRSGIDAQIDLIRSSLNKMTDKNYKEQCEKINDILIALIADTSDTDMSCIGNAIFEIASNNRFYSKLYADLYSNLIQNFDIMKNVFEQNLSTFMCLFENIEHINPEENYDKFCKINKDNEKRKALSLFFVNLMNNKIIPSSKIIELTHNLLTQVYTLIKDENKKNEVDEMIENIAIFYNKKLLSASDVKINDLTLIEIIKTLSQSKPKMYPSLSNKSIFKFMNLIEM